MTATADESEPGRFSWRIGDLPHLCAAVLALLIFAASLGAEVSYAHRLENRYVRGLAKPEVDYEHRSAALHAAALRHRDLLVVYGSSELRIANPFRASELFQTYPTGFDVFPVGRAGTTSLIMVQDLAAVAPAVRDKKVVVSVSPSWFYNNPMAPANYYAGNFSRLQAYALAFSTRLGYGVRQRAARRMLQYPRTLEDPFLKLSLETLADRSLASQVLYRVLWPLGKLEEAVLRLQDHWQAVELIRGRPDLSRHEPHVPAPLDWPQLIAAAERDPGRQRRIRPGRGYGAESMVSFMQNSAEWTDLETLFRELRDLGARPLILSMPMKGSFYDTQGISREMRDRLYYDRLRRLAERYGFPVVDFEEEDEDPGFLDGATAHLARKGWVYYARTLDRFYHDSLG